LAGVSRHIRLVTEGIREETAMTISRYVGIPLLTLASVAASLVMLPIEPSGHSPASATGDQISALTAAVVR
jgi:hypothetical protein